MQLLSNPRSSVNLTKRNATGVQFEILYTADVCKIVYTKTL